MNLTLTRDVLTPEFTLGSISDEAGRLCYTVEDAVRDVKIPGRTCIPAGRYQIVVTFSNRFQKPLPLLLKVPGFEGIRIHSGNRATDSEGCILPGRIRTPDGVAESRLAFNELFMMIQTALETDQVWITIS